jgi:hypothetical protein
MPDALQNILKIVVQTFMDHFEQSKGTRKMNTSKNQNPIQNIDFFKIKF